jgi:hypothetical protein
MRYIRSRSLLVAAAILALLAAAAMGMYAMQRVSPSVSLIREIKALPSGPERVALYERLIEEEGLIQAQELLYRSGIPFDGESHLLNHTSGVYAYEKLGTEGILSCKDYFLQSCYHGFLIEFIALNGIERIGDVIAVCSGAGQYVMDQCSHGIGHGLLAWVGYKNLLDAFAWCDTINETNPDLVTSQCYNGVAMENNWAVHEGGGPSPDRWIKADDPYYPCNHPGIKPEWQNACWQNQGSIIFQHYKGDYEKTYHACLAVEDSNNRDACLNNLARQIHPGAQGSADRARALCGIMEENDRALCIARVAGSEYSVGGRVLPFELCAAEAEPSRETCYSTLFHTVRALTPPTEDPLRYCEAIEHDGYRADCVNIVTR